jgi:PST family polysaccharide transporter
VGHVLGEEDGLTRPEGRAPEGARVGLSGRARDTLNLSSLYLSLGLNALINLALIAYLARVLQPEIWGMVLLAQAFGYWVAMVPEYGFSLSGGRAIARVQGISAEVAEIVTAVNASKALLATLLVPIGALAFFAMPSFQAAPLFLLGALLFACAQGFDPVWYFQGIERHFIYAGITTVARLAVLALMVLLVRSPEDGATVMFLHAAGAGGIFLAAWLFMRVRHPGERIPASRVRTMLASAWPVFQFRAAQSLTTNSSLVILGLVSPPGVPAFGSAERILRNCLGLLGPISAAGMPKISRLLGSDPDSARRTARLSFAVMTGFGAAIALALFLLAPLIVSILLGPAYGFVVPILRITTIALPFAAASSMLGVQWMLPLGMDKQLVRITFGGGVLNVIGCAVLGYYFGATGVAGMMVAVETGMAITMVLVLHRLRQATFW